MMEVLETLENGAKRVEHRERDYHGTVTPHRYYWYEGCTCDQGRVWVHNSGCMAYAIQCTVCESAMTRWAREHGRIRYVVLRRPQLVLECLVNGKWKKWDKMVALDAKDVVSGFYTKAKKVLRLRYDPSVGNTALVDCYETNAQARIIRWVGREHFTSLEKAQAWIGEEMGTQLREFWLR